MKKRLIFFSFILIAAALIQLNMTVTAAREDGIYGDKITFITEEESSEIVEVIAEGNAVIIYGETNIKADNARYITESQDIILSGQVTLNSQNYLVEGRKLTGNLAREEFRLTEAVKMTGEEMVITADSLYYQLATAEAVLEGGANLDYRQIEARADKITFNTENESAVLAGGVRGQRNGEKFSGDRLLIDPAGKGFVLTGNARLLFDGEESSEE